jgi:hypothetical protein
MTPPKQYFDLKIDTLRILAGWASDCADKVLLIFEETCPGDLRPRRAIEGARAFAAGAKRTQNLRILAMDAFRAANETEDPAASAAAQAASLAAASAFTHPLVDVQQTKHILGPAAYAALAVEIEHNNDPQCGESEIRSAIKSAPREVGEILLKMPARSMGKSRIDLLMYMLDKGLRNRYSSG